MSENYLIHRNVCVGVDLGQSRDPTSIAVMEQIKHEVNPDVVTWLRSQGNPGAERLADIRRSTPRPEYILRLLEQAPLGEPYPAQAQRVKRVVARLQTAGHDPKVYIDYTGVGRAVYDIFRTERVPRLVPVTITFNGQEGPNGHGGHSIPKINLISRLQALMHTGVMRMPDTLPLAKLFRRELLDFRVSYTQVGNATFGAREGAHDDLILAVALAVYGFEQPRCEIMPLGAVIAHVS